MTSHTRSRVSEEQWKDMEARLGEINTSCHRLIESSNASLENNIIEKIDQLVSLVTKCDSKIESYNATIDDRIKHQMMGLLRGQGFERMKGPRDRANRGVLQQPRIELCSFQGEDPRVWLRKCNKFFVVNQVSDSHKLDYMEMFLDGKADIWFQSFKLVKEKISWDDFCESLTKRFGKKGGFDEHDEFNKLVQGGPVLEYVEKFEELKSVLLCRNPQLDEKYFISSFISRLKSELKPMVRLMKPANLLDSIEVAQLQEQTVELMVKMHEIKKMSSTINVKWGTTGKKGDVKIVEEKKEGNIKENFKKISLEEFQYRRNNHLCYMRGDKFSQGHQCKNQQYTFMLIEDGEKDVLEEMIEEVEGTITEVSLNALSEKMNRKTITLEGSIQKSKVQMLVDTGSSLSCIDNKVVKNIGLQKQNCDAITVKLADGRTVVSSFYVPKVKWTIQQYEFEFDLRIIDISGWDMIIGVDWLEQFSPIMFDFKKLYLKLNADSNNENQMMLNGRVEAATIQLVRGKELQLMNKKLAQQALKEKVCVAAESLEKFPGQKPDILQRFSKVFEVPVGLPPNRKVDHEIPLQQGSQLFKMKPYKYPHSQKIEIETQVQQMLDSGTIKPSNSPFASPDKFPIPNIDELLDELHGAHVFSKLDFRSGYHQILVKPSDTYKITFQTHHGHFEFVVMPFGLTNAPATFQGLMNQVFKHSDLESHERHLEAVLELLQANQLYAKMSNCSFVVESVEYLGHMISGKGVSMDPAKVESIIKWPVPDSIKTLRGFLGLSGYYRRFIRGYGIMKKPLTDLLKKDGFQWGPEATKAFQLLKKALSKAPVLEMPNFDLPFVVETDACATGMGAVLMQQGKPIFFLSKAFNKKNMGCSVYEKELLALVLAVTKWRHYLVGHHFIIKTDHQSLKFLLEHPRHTSLQYTWLSKMLGDYEIQYKKGCENIAADALSRVVEQPATACVAAISELQHVWLQQVVSSYEGDEECQNLISKLNAKVWTFYSLSHPFTAEKVANVFLDNIFKLHGLPDTIVCDRDRIFTSIFWKSLFEKLGVTLNFTSAYHPQSDGQTERLNQCLEAYLRCFSGDRPSTWKNWLSVAEYWYNTSFHASLGTTPFEALYGIKPVPIS
ncbi:uncharacterized protein LOC108207202 [Daucus carota subsp. sativus]|uniref:uncharacterized protein LOC108207202 n=1 Tax=Daucus carota subsp. sativus TaxID=79200 RepID=UPI0007EF1208|nr:PREDICTED: uncharacterized protein LOC108207202 [Daucus carota subsp. sativus]